MPTRLALLFLTCLLFSRGLAAAEAERPNILFIFADDQCFRTINALGNEEVQTPNLDSLVQRGTTFTHAYNQGGWNGAICVASRTMLVSGRYIWNANRLDLNEERLRKRLWPQIMSRRGYETYFSGKWHVKVKPEQIFDVVKNVRGGMPQQTPSGYNRPLTGQPDQWKPWDKSKGGFWAGGKHWSEVLADDADEFLTRAAKRDAPFFMYLAFNAPHDPRQSPKEFVDRYPLEKIAVPKNFVPEHPNCYAIGAGPKLRDEALAPFPRTEHAVKVHRQEYYAIITHMDEQIGRILTKLKQTGKADNTWIIFTADHGLACGEHGLMGKQNMYDHSVRVPLVIVRPGQSDPATINSPVYLQDVMATAIELAGAEDADTVEFDSLLPYLQGDQPEEQPQAIYGAYLNKQRMVTADGYKLILYPDVPERLLFHVADDPLELQNLAGDPEQASRIKRLAQTLKRLQVETGDRLDLTDAFPDLFPEDD